MFQYIPSLKKQHNSAVEQNHNVTVDSGINSALVLSVQKSVICLRAPLSAVSTPVSPALWKDISQSKTASVSGYPMWIFPNSVISAMRRKVT